VLTRRPNLFIVGAPKSGTTSLYWYIHDHPDVFMSDMKEPMYFSSDVYRGPRNRFDYGPDEDQYLALFAGASDEKYVGEASTHYLAAPPTPARIHDFQPEARIVCILRDPIEMAYAWHGERVYRSVEPREPFSLELLNTDRGRKYLEIGCYGTQLTRYFGTFGRERVKVIIFEDFAAKTAAEFRGVLEFLEIDPDYQPDTFEARNSVTAKSRLVPWLHSRPARRAASVLRGVGGERLATGVSKTLRALPVVNSRKPRPPLQPAVRQRLLDVYAGEIERAGELLGRDLTALWLKTPPTDSAAEVTPARA
jgi:sulfotransferase family protein